MDWSPDGRWVIYMEAQDFWSGESGFATNFSVTEIRAASIFGGVPRKLTTIEYGTQVLGAWRSAFEFLMTTETENNLPANLQLVNINTVRTTNIYADAVTEEATDPDSGSIAFVSIATSLNTQAWGFFIVPSRQTTPVKIETASWGLPNPIVWHEETGFFYGAFGNGVMIIDNSGKVLDSIEEECLPIASPDGRWLVMGAWDCNPDIEPKPGMRLYDSNGAFVAELSTENVAKPIWSPDSTGIFFNGQLPTGEGYFSDLRFVSVPTGEVSTLHPNPGVEFFALVQP
jgi:Tol biopolymer transport system component